MLFVLSSLLQVFDILITAFALHFSSCAIKGLQTLGKVGMMEEAILKTNNEIGHGIPESF